LADSITLLCAFAELTGDSVGFGQLLVAIEFGGMLYFTYPQANRALILWFCAWRCTYPPMRPIIVAIVLLLPPVTGCASVDSGGCLGSLLNMAFDPSPSDTSTRSGKAAMWEWENRQNNNP
jgi:hypothetical protein